MPLKERAVRTVRLVILGIVTVLGWSAAAFLLRTDVPLWDQIVSTIMGVTLAYPFLAEVGVAGKSYARFGLTMIIAVPLLSLLLFNKISPDKGHWITLAILVFAAGGMIVQAVRRRAC